MIPTRNPFYVLFVISFCLLFSAAESNSFSKQLPGLSLERTSNQKPESSIAPASMPEEFIIWEDDFESGENGWTLDAGWQLTETKSHSPSHSLQSPNTDATKAGNYNVVSPALDLPEIGESETLHFKFWINADMPDYAQSDDPATLDVDESGYLADYYRLSLLDLTATSWHSTSENADNGNNFWCADPEVGGYRDGWIQFLDTPSISLGSNGKLASRIYYAIEDFTGASGEVDGSCTDGWDAANIRISADGGETWSLLTDSANPYHFDCGYGWIYNESEYETGGTLNHLAKGWGGLSNNWLDFNADLSSYAGKDIIIRFAFGSDPAYSTADDGNGNAVPSITGFQVDTITITDDSGTKFSDQGNDLSLMTAKGEVWITQFHDYSSAEAGRPGSNGWEEYTSGMPYNGNTFLDITDYAGKEVQIRIQTRYDDNHEGGQGDGLFIDDFTIYKQSSGAYFSPGNLKADAQSGQVSLSWSDMNAAGTEDFIYENGVFDPAHNIYVEGGNGWAGTLFPIVGPSKVNSFSLYNTAGDTTVRVQAYGMFGQTIDTDPLYSVNADLNSGWNHIDVTDWNMENYFVIAHEINDHYGVALDTTVAGGHSVLRLSGTWAFAYSYNIPGEFGVRANISYEGANVSYNVYRDELKIVSGLTDSTYIDTEVENNTTYEYAVSATYSDGEESGLSTSIEATPLASSVVEHAYDDGTFESEYNAGSGNYAAVRFAGGNGSILSRVKWYQKEDGGAFYIKVFTDNNGVPDEEIFSTVQASGNLLGWNEKDVSDREISLGDYFWIATKEFNTTQPFGLDTSTNEGNSFYRVGDEGGWSAIEGNLAIRAFVDGTPLSVPQASHPERFGVTSIYPNPFNPRTTIEYKVTNFQQVTLNVYDISGRHIYSLVDASKSRGNYTAVWNGINHAGEPVSSGIYLVVLQSENGIKNTRQMVLLK